MQTNYHTTVSAVSRCVFKIQPGLSTGQNLTDKYTWLPVRSVLRSMIVADIDARGND